jgi:hypothetical protein
VIFDVHGSVHLGNVYVRLNVQLDVHGFMYSLLLYIFTLLVSGAICTHPKEHKLQSRALGVCNGRGIQTVVREPQVVLGFCPCGPLRMNISPKKTEKIKLT